MHVGETDLWSCSQVSVSTGSRRETDGGEGGACVEEGERDAGGAEGKQQTARLLRGRAAWPLAPSSPPPPLLLL